ncbi:MAG: GHKL domain-containing protein [Oscillospiraceae bacterium]
MILGVVAIVLATFMEAIIVSVFTHQLVEPRINKWLSIFLYAAVITIVFDLLIPLETNHMAIKSAIWFIFYTVFPLLMFKGRRIKILLVQLCCVIFMLTCEIFVMAIVNIFGISLNVVKGFSVERATIMMLGNVPFVALVIIALLFWDKRKSKLETRSMLLFVMFPISQVVLILATVINNYKVFSQETVFAISFVGGLVSLVADVAMITAMLENSRKAELEKRINEMEYQNEVELVYYENLHTRNEELAKIRHDFKNQIAVVTTLIDKEKSGGNTDGKNILDALQNVLVATEIGEYTQNDIVNAVLSDKAATCKEKQINMDIDVAVPANINIEKLHICSVFANLLDNAIKAVSATEVKDKSIIVRARCEPQYLFIKVENKYASLPKTERHGYGLEIVNDIANKYNGELVIQKANGTFTAIVSLKI